MVFSSVAFLFYFLPATLFLYTLAPPRARNTTLLIASLVFYTWGSGWLVSLLAVSVLVDYVLGFVAARAHARQDRRLRLVAVVGTVGVNLTLLGWFKYAGWLIGEAADAGLWTGTVPEITLPIGISFFTFQSMSYTLDVVRGRCEHLANPIDFALYVTLFPQLIAGPIVRFHEIDEQIRHREMTLAGVGEGALRFSHGLAKKVIVADTVAPVANAAFATGDPTMAVAWIGVIAYAMQIYFDFSGYSDMAIGLGRMFGFSFPENFRRPYSAVSITDFWRRWHITLSNWFRDYVYIPLGGSRGSPARVYRNLVIVFLLTGVWHGANWTFVLWGLFHGGWLLVERRFGWRNVDDEASFVGPRRATTFVIVLFGWVLFRSPEVDTAFEYYRSMLSFDSMSIASIRPALTDRAVLTLGLASLVVTLPREVVIGPLLVTDDRPAMTVVRSVVMIAALPASVLLIASGAFSPFLYFQF